jgi:chitin synthase
LTFIIGINAVATFCVYQYNEFKGIAIILIILKSKDIICAIVLPVYFLVKAVRGIFNKIVHTEVLYDGSFVSILPVYDESIEIVKESLKSINDSDIPKDKHMICIISDGKKEVDEVKALVDTVTKEVIWKIVSWNKVEYNVNILFGLQNGIPTMIVVKEENVGKRDSIILAFDIFNHLRNNANNDIIELRQHIREYIKETYCIDTFDYMFCTDADTQIANDSISKLAKEIVARKAIAACGLVCVNFNGSHFSFWKVYQNFQYMFGQFVRRSVENLLGKVTCLPGCITLFKVDVVASTVIEKYGALPNEDNMVESMVQNIGTDRRLTSLFLYEGTTTTFQYNAIAYTNPPTTLRAFIRQRRRWVGNTYFNTLMNIVGLKIPVIIKLFSMLDILKLSFVYFRLFNVTMFLYQLVTDIRVTTFIAQVIVVCWPMFYFFVFTLFITMLRKQYLKLVVGWVFNKLLAGMLSVATSSTMMFNIGNYNWNKATKLTEVLVEQNQNNTT